MQCKFANHPSFLTSNKKFELLCFKIQLSKNLGKDFFKVCPAIENSWLRATRTLTYLKIAVMIGIEW